MQCLSTALHLLGVKAPHPALDAELRSVQASGLQDQRELVGRSPSLGIILAGWYNLACISPGLAPLVEVDHVDPQLLGAFSQALGMGRPHSPADISLDSLAKVESRSIPSGPLMVGMIGMERRHLFWQREPQAGDRACGGRPHPLSASR